MLRNFLKIAVRQFQKQAFFSGINLFGLTIGLTGCLLIALYVQHECRFDRFLPAADRICAVTLDLKMGDTEGQTTNTPPPLGPQMAADFSEIERVARTFNLGTVVVRRENPGQAPTLFNENTAFAADTSFLELFGFPMLSGDPAVVLDKPGSIVLSEKIAGKYFGQEPAVGQTLFVNDRMFTVSGVVKALPSTSTVQFDLLLPMADYRVVDHFSWSWIWLQMDTWVRLKQAPDSKNIAALEAKFPGMVMAHAPAAYTRIGQDFLENLKHGDRYAVKLLPLKSLHLGAKGLDSRLTTLGDRGQVLVFGLAGLLILFLACVNYMNLSTARSFKRTREVGVRKALGSQRGALIRQFLTESALYSILAMGLALILAGMCLPWYNQLTGLEWQPGALFAGAMPGVILALVVLTGILGGLYPAVYLSGFSIMQVFKSSTGGTGAGHAHIRGGLVVFQFSVSIVLMLVSFTVYKQLQFVQKQLPGLDREQVLVIENAQHLAGPEAVETFRRQLADLPETEGASHSTFLPSLGSFGDFYEPEQGEQPRAVVPNLLISSYLTDADLVPVLGMDILAGRNFLPEPGSDSNSVILNETAVKAIGWENPIGKWMRYPGNRNQRFQVVGVVRDFMITTAKMPVEPVALFHKSSKTYRTWGSYLAVRLRPGTENTAIEKVAGMWKKAVPGAPFEYDFLDSSFGRLYRSEARTGAVLGIFTCLALLIGCLGLFALAVFMAARRRKEIAIRKVVGASVPGLAVLLTKDFLKLVVPAVILATPTAWYFMQRWLQNYVYRIPIEAWMFVAAGSAAVGIALLTVGVNSIRAALAHPVQSLRSE